MQKWWKESEIEQIKEAEWFPKHLDIDLTDNSIFKFFKIVNNYVHLHDKLCKK